MEEEIMKWVSVEDDEKAPEKFIATDGQRIYQCYGLTKGNRKGEENIFYAPIDCGYNEDIDTMEHITHWGPLPELPKKDWINQEKA